MNRRTFGKTLAVSSLTLTSAALIEGCNSASVWFQIEGWVPVGISAFESILAIVAPLASPAIDAAAELVKAGFATLAGAIDDYINAPAADKATLGARVKLILQEISANFQKFVNAINVSSNPIVKIAAALIGVIVNTIAGFLGGITTTVSTSETTPIQVVQAVKMNRKQFTALFNQTLATNGQPSTLNIPHSAPVRQ